MVGGAAPRLLVVADRGVCATDDDYLTTVVALSRACGGGETAVQVRVKSGGGAHLAAAVRRAVTATDCLLLLNGAAARALSLGFGGAHLPQAEIPAEPLVVPPGFVLGASVHDLPSLAAAERAGVLYVVFGPVWAPGSKAAAPVGVAALADITRRARVPVLAIGGVTPERVAACRAAGAHGVAVVSGVMGRRDRAVAVGEYVAALRG